MEGGEQNMDFIGRSLHSPLTLEPMEQKRSKAFAAAKLELVHDDSRNACAAPESFLKTTSTDLRSTPCAALPGRTTKNMKTRFF